MRVSPEHGCTEEEVAAAEAEWQTLLEAEEAYARWEERMEWLRETENARESQ